MDSEKKPFSDHLDSERDGHERFFSTNQPFWMIMKTFCNHPNAERDTETDADHKPLFTHHIGTITRGNIVKIYILKFHILLKTINFEREKKFLISYLSRGKNCIGSNSVSKSCEKLTKACLYVS